MENRSLDDIIKSSLENFEVEQNSHDWAFMEKMLDNEASTDDLSEGNDIDAIAKNALQNHIVPFAETDWEIMDSLLDDAGFPHEIDQTARKALQDFEASSPNWERMEATLSEIEHIRRHLILSKSIEVVLFIFAIWTVGNFLPFKQKTSKSPSAIKTEQENSITEPQIESRFHINSNSTTTEDAGNNAVRNATQNSTPHIQKTYLFEKNNNFNKFDALPLQPINIDKNTSIETEGVVPNVIDSSSTTPLAINSEQYLLNAKNHRPQERHNPVVASFIEHKASTLFFENSAIATLNPYATTPDAPFHLKAAVTTQHVMIQKEDRSHFAVGLAKSIGVDYAISDRIELSTGFAFNNNTYTYKDLEPFVNASSPKIVEISRNVQLDILQVPLRVNLNLKKDRKTRLYAIAGITSSVILKEETRDADASLISDVTPATYRTIVEESRNNASNIETATLNSNRLKTFATTDFGIGLEYKTHKKFSFFIESLFQKSIKNTQYQDESYKNYALAVGSRVAL